MRRVSASEEGGGCAESCPRERVHVRVGSSAGPCPRCSEEGHSKPREQLEQRYKAEVCLETRTDSVYLECRACGRQSTELRLVRQGKKPSNKTQEWGLPWWPSG